MVTLITKGVMVSIGDIFWSISLFQKLLLTLGYLYYQNINKLIATPSYYNEQ